MAQEQINSFFCPHENKEVILIKKLHSSLTNHYHVCSECFDENEEFADKSIVLSEVRN